MAVWLLVECVYGAEMGRPKQISGPSLGREGFALEAVRWRMLATDCYHYSSPTISVAEVILWRSFCPS